MKSYQIMVDIDEGSCKMDSQINEEVEQMSGYNRGAVNPLLWRDLSDKEKIDRTKNLMESKAKQLISLMGVDINKFTSYVHGKTMAMAICYGASLDNAKAIAANSSKNIKFVEFSSNTRLIAKFVRDPSKYNTYDDLVEAVYAGKLKKARKLAVNPWKKNLAQGIVKDVETLKNVLENGCHTMNKGVQSTSEVPAATAEFLEEILKFVKEI